MTMVHARSWRHGLGITFLLLACVVLLCACEAGAPPEQSAGDVPAADTAAVATAAMDSASNPVQREMRLLDEAIRVSITAIANDAPQAAVPALERVHGARMETEAYLHSGQYAPLADHDSLEAFAAVGGFRRTRRGSHEALLVRNLAAAGWPAVSLDDPASGQVRPELQVVPAVGPDLRAAQDALEREAGLLQGALLREVRDVG